MNPTPLTTSGVYATPGTVYGSSSYLPAYSSGLAVPGYGAPGYYTSSYNPYPTYGPTNSNLGYSFLSGQVPMQSLASSLASYGQYPQQYYPQQYSGYYY